MVQQSHRHARPVLGHDFIFFGRPLRETYFHQIGQDGSGSAQLLFPGLHAGDGAAGSLGNLLVAVFAKQPILGSSPVAVHAGQFDRQPVGSLAGLFRAGVEWAG